MENAEGKDQRDCVVEAARLLASSASESDEPEKNGKTRPLGIPVMKCRAMQVLHLLALEPIAQWVFEADIQGCFDKISHYWMITNIPTDKVVLKKC